MNQSVKVSVNLAEADVELLGTVAASTGMSRSEVIRHAIGLERLAQDIRNNPHKHLLLIKGRQTFQVFPRKPQRNPSHLHPPDWHSNST